MTLSITNTLNDPITVHSVSSSCGCLSDAGSSVNLDPLQTIERAVSLNLFNHQCTPIEHASGVQYRSNVILHYSLGGEKRKAITHRLNGRIRPPLAPLPDIDFGIAHASENASRIIPLNEMRPIESLTLECDNRAFRATQVRDQYGKRAVKVEFLQSLGNNYQSGRLKIRGRCDESPTLFGIDVFLYGRMESDLATAPSFAVFAPCTSGVKQQQSLIIRSLLDSNLRVVSYSVAKPFHCEASSERKDQFVISYQPDQPGDHSEIATIVIECQDGTNRTLQVPVHGHCVANSEKQS